MELSNGSTVFGVEISKLFIWNSNFRSEFTDIFIRKIYIQLKNYFLQNKFKFQILFNRSFRKRSYFQGKET